MVKALPLSSLALCALPWKASSASRDAARLLAPQNLHRALGRPGGLRAAAPGASIRQSRRRAWPGSGEG